MPANYEAVAQLKLNAISQEKAAIQLHIDTNILTKFKYDFDVQITSPVVTSNSDLVKQLVEHFQGVVVSAGFKNSHVRVYTQAEVNARPEQWRNEVHRLGMGIGAGMPANKYPISTNVGPDEAMFLSFHIAR